MHRFKILAIVGVGAGLIVWGCGGSTTNGGNGGGGDGGGSDATGSSSGAVGGMFPCGMAGAMCGPPKVCCETFSMGGLTGTCDTGCDGGIALSCGPDSCPTGDLCCGSITMGMGSSACASGTTCPAGEVQLCSMAHPCPTGEHCSNRTHTCRQNFDGGGMMDSGQGDTGTAGDGAATD